MEIAKPTSPEPQENVSTYKNTVALRLEAQSEAVVTQNIVTITIENVKSASTDKSVPGIILELQSTEVLFFASPKYQSLISGGLIKSGVYITMGLVDAHAGLDLINKTCVGLY